MPTKISFKVSANTVTTWFNQDGENWCIEDDWSKRTNIDAFVDHIRSQILGEDPTLEDDYLEPILMDLAHKMRSQRSGRAEDSRTWNCPIQSPIFGGIADEIQDDLRQIKKGSTK